MTRPGTLTSPLRRTTTARPPRPAAHSSAERCRSLDLRGGQTDHDRVARLDRSLDDLGEAAVADAGPDLHRLQLLVRVEQIDGLRFPRRPLLPLDGVAEAAGRAAESAPALSHALHSPLEAPAAGGAGG